MRAFVAAILGNAPPSARPPIALVKQNHLGPLAYRLGLAELRDEYAASAITVSRREDLLRELVVAFKAHDVRTALIKGIAFAGTIYADPAERPMQDIDLLVPRKQLTDAVRCMHELGFVRVGHSRKLSGYYHSLAFVRSGMMVELHREIMQVYRTQMRVGDLWRRAVPDPRGSGAERLDPTDDLLICILHIARHELAVPALNYVDVSRLWNQLDGAGRDALDVRANEYRVSRAVRAVLAMTGLLRNGGSGTPDVGWASRILPTTDDVLRGARPRRLRQIGQKLVLTEGARELMGLGVAYGAAVLQSELRRRR